MHVRRSNCKYSLLVIKTTVRLPTDSYLMYSRYIYACLGKIESSREYNNSGTIIVITTKRYLLIKDCMCLLVQR